MSPSFVFTLVESLTGVDEAMIDAQWSMLYESQPSKRSRLNDSVDDISKVTCWRSLLTHRLEAYLFFSLSLSLQTGLSIASFMPYSSWRLNLFFKRQYSFKNWLIRKCQSTSIHKDKDAHTHTHTHTNVDLMIFRSTRRTIEAERSVVMIKKMKKERESERETRRFDDRRWNEWMSRNRVRRRSLHLPNRFGTDWTMRKTGLIEEESGIAKKQMRTEMLCWTSFKRHSCTFF